MKLNSAFILFTISIFWSVYSFANDCRSLPSELPQLEIINLENEIEYDFSKTRKEITKIDRYKLYGTPLKDEQLYIIPSDLILTGSNLGLTIGKYGYQLFFLPEFIDMGSGVFCPRVKKIMIKFTYKSRIYVAKEYPIKGCGFNEILAHEMEHHNINVRNKKKYLGWLRSDLQAVMNEITKSYQPVKESQVKSAFKKIQTDLRETIDTYIYRMHLDTYKENKKLDSSDEYLRLSRALERCYKESEKRKEELRKQKASE